MATPEQLDELKGKISGLVDTKFGGDYTKAFNHYAELSGAGGLVERTDLLQLLEDAGVGSWLSRGAWADGIMKELDTNKDKGISWEEFETVVKKGG
ncbi:MAG: EF-hand domain-containing protein [Deltaproteobacteria bacterium]|nr:EF-hand domain-containing protein [Deltaproteobacteria bacterium]